MNKPPLGYKLSEVGVIPEEWEVKHLSCLAEIRTGIANNSNSTVSNPEFVHYLRVANVQDGFLDLSDMSKIRISRDDIARYAMQPGDVLMNEGGDLDKLGRGSIWHGEFNPCVHQNHVFVVRCHQTISPDFLIYWTGSTPARQYFLLAGRQTTNLASINKMALGQLPVPFPANQAEQRAIAAALSDVDALIAILDQFIAKKRDLKQAAMQQLLTGQTRLPGFGAAVGAGLKPAPTVPDGWEVKRLGDVFNIFAGGDFDPARSSNVQDELHPFPVYSNAITDCGLYGFCTYNTYPANTITVTARGTLGVTHFSDHKYTAIGRVLVLQSKAEIDGRFFAAFINNRIDFVIESTGVPQLTAPPSFNLRTTHSALSRAIRHRRRPLRHGRRTRSPSGPPRQDPRPQAGHDAGIAHREDTAGMRPLRIFISSVQ